MRRSRATGFTLMELIIVTAIIMILIMTALSVLLGVQNTFFRTAMRLDNEIEEALGQRAVWLNLLNSGPSYNNINQPDDNNREFFDFFPDVSRLAFAAADRTRVKTLQNIGDSIHFLLFDRDSQPVAYYDTARAYTITEGANVGTTGTMAFSGVNNGGYLDNLNPVMWRPNSMIMLYSPTSLRPLNAPLTTAPRFTIYTGVVNGNALPAETAGGIIRNTHPVTGAAVANEDEFFRTAPAVGGVAPFILVAGVSLIRYRIVPSPTSPTGKMLQRQTWQNNAWQVPFPIAISVNRVIFRRPSVLVPTINVDMQF